MGSTSATKPVAVAVWFGLQEIGKKACSSCIQLQRLAHHAHRILVQPVQVGLLAQPCGERGHGLCYASTFYTASVKKSQQPNRASELRRTLLPRTRVNEVGKARDLMTRQIISGHYGVALRPDAEAGHDLWDALIMEVHPVALAEFGSSTPVLLLIDLPRGELRRNLLILVVPTLEAPWCMHLDDPDGLGARIAQGVVDASGLDHVGADRGDHDLPAHIARQLALQYVAALMLPAVGVRRYHHAGRKPPLHDGSRTAEALRWNLVSYVQDRKMGALVRTDEDLLVIFPRHGILPYALRM